MRQAYLQASGNGALPAKARQIYYAIREPVQQLTGRRLEAGYFSQTVLPAYLRDHLEAATWNVAYDDRGHFREPHSTELVGLGTLNVRAYIRKCLASGGVTVQGLGVLDPVKVTAYGPKTRYGAFLYIEKEGFNDLFEAVRLAERYDIGIISAKGQSTTAARELVDTLCSRHGIPLLVLHDFDRMGFQIASILQRDTQRYQFRNSIEVIDLGIRLADAEKYRLPAENVIHEKISPLALRSQLQQNGATDQEIMFLMNHRVELNAFTSPQLVEWIEGKLDEVGVKKVVPGRAALERVYRVNLSKAYFVKHTQDIVQQAQDFANRQQISSDLAEQVRELLDDDPTIPWDEAIEQMVDALAADDQKNGVTDSGTNSNE
jgi:hypothetical protein